MAGKGSNRKAARKPKTSRGGYAKGARRERPPELLLISMNKGMAHQTKRRR